MVRYAFFVLARGRYVGTRFEFEFERGLNTVCWYEEETFYVQRAAVNEDSCDRAGRAHSLGYSQVIIIAS